MTKFVNDKLPMQYAEELHNVQLKMARLKKQLADLETQERQLTGHLIKMSRGKSFEFNSGAHLKHFVVRNHQRMILDQERVLQILKNKTPYKESAWTTVKVDYVYETTK